MPFKVGEDWTNSDEDFKTTGTLESGDQTINGNETITGDLDVAGSITQDSEDLLDDSDRLVNGGNLAQVYIQTTAPAHVAGTIWIDITNNILKIRNKDNSDWLSVWDITNDKPVIDNLSDDITASMIADGAIDAAAKVVDGVLTPAKTGSMGALIALSNSDFSVADSTPDTIDWDYSVYDTDSFGDIGGSNPSRLTIPAGVSKVVLHLQLIMIPAASADSAILLTALYKNGAVFAGGLFNSVKDFLFSDHVYYCLHFTSPPISVSEDDYFEAYVSWNDYVGSVALTVLGATAYNYSWFGIEVVE